MPSLDHELRCSDLGEQTDRSLHTFEVVVLLGLGMVCMVLEVLGMVRMV